MAVICALYWSVLNYDVGKLYGPLPYIANKEFIYFIKELFTFLH